MRLDVVIPAYNEAARIDRTLRAYRSVMNAPMTRFLIALDRCTDETATVVHAHANVDHRVEILRYPKLGKGGVLMESFRQCDADLVGFVDADCATPPAEFLRLVETVAGAGAGVPVADVAIASRFHPSSVLPTGRSVTRRISSRSFAALVRVLFGLPCSDTQCGAKVMRRDVVSGALPLLSSRDFLFDVDLLLTADRLGFNIVEVPTVWLDREGSHVHAASDAGRMAASSLRLWIHHRVLPVPSPERLPTENGMEVTGAPDRTEAVNDQIQREDRVEAGLRRDRSEPSQQNGETAKATSRASNKRRRSARCRADVALVSPYPSGGAGAVPSGVASYAARLADSLAEAGAAVHVVAPAVGDELPPRGDGRVTVSRPFSPGPLAVPAALGAARRTGAPIVHLQHELFLYGGPSSVPGLVPGLAQLRASRARSVATMHQVVNPREVDDRFTALHRVRAPAPIARVGLATIQRSIVGLTTTTIVHEQAFADILEGAVVVPLGIDLAETPPPGEAKRALGLAADALVVLCFGFLAPYKGLESALEAARLAGPGVQLVVAGGEHPRLAGRDPYASELRHQYEHVARFPGYIPEREVATWFAAADVVLVPYPRPFASSGPFALGLGYRRPVLCSPPFARCVGAPDQMVASLDPTELCAHLLRLSADPKERSALRAISARLAAERTWSRVAHAHLDLYEEVIDADRTPGRRLRAGSPR